MKKMKKQHIIVPVVMIAIVAAMIVPASAWWYTGGLPLSDSAYCNADPEYRCTVWENIVVVNGTYNIELINGDILPEDYNYTFTVPDYDTLMYAGLYEDVWSANSCGPMEFTYNDHFFGELHFGTLGAGCGHNPCDNNDNVAGNGCGGNGVWWDVTALTNPGQINWYYKNDTSRPELCIFDGRDRGCSLITWGQNFGSSDDTLNIWFNQGMGIDPTPDTNIYNVNAAVADHWTLCVCIGTAENTDYIEFNNNRLDWLAPDHWLDVNCYDVTAYMNTIGTTNTIEWFSGDEYFHPYWTLLIGAGGAPKLDPIDIVLPEMMRPNTGYTIQATIKNTGGSTSAPDTATLYVDGVLNGTATIPPLASGVSTTISFTPQVNLPWGCYEFKVVVDSCNNEINELGQVDNVIVVRSNTDLATLDLATYSIPDDTYYIQGHSITNCAGVGITIENTTDKFVITDCTVYDCQGDGVQFYNIANGAIEESTVRDNSGKGIRVKKSKYVDITDNDMISNEGYGVETYPRTLGPDEYLCDCEYINIANNNASDNFYGIELIGCNSSVKNNTVSYNSDYGMYVHGNYNRICGNDIQSNHDYGMKVYNATENCILWNDFVTNNIDYPGRTSQAWDNSVNSNYWNTTNETCHEYIPIPEPDCHQNRQGNYWSDYTGADPDGDGIGDTTDYDIDGGAMADDYPLIATVQNYEHICCGDVTCSRGPPGPPDLVELTNNVTGQVQLICAWAGNVDGSPIERAAPPDVVKLTNNVNGLCELNCKRGCPHCANCFYCRGCPPW